MWYDTKSVYVGLAIGLLTTTIMYISMSDNREKGRNDILSGKVICVADGVVDKEITYECKTKEQFQKELEFLLKLQPKVITPQNNGKPL